jgi:hypothetical protein
MSTKFNNEFGTVRLSDHKTFDVESIGFSKPVVNNYGGYRLNCGVNHPDGSKSGLFLSLPPGLFSFGTRQFEMNGNISWSHSISLMNRDNPSDEELQFVELLKDIARTLYENLDSNDVKKITRHGKSPPLETVTQTLVSYKKSETGEIDHDSIPCLYVGLIVNKTKGTRRDCLYDNKTGKVFNFEDLEDKIHTVVQGVVKIGGVYIGNKISIQAQLWEADVEVRDGGGKRLLARPGRLMRQDLPVDDSDLLASSDSDLSD